MPISEIIQKCIDLANKILLQTAVSSLQEGMAFYEKLNFTNRFTQKDWAVYSDSQVDVLIDGRTGSRSGLVFCVDDMARIESLTPQGQHWFDYFDGKMTADQNGVRLFVRAADTIEWQDTAALDKNSCGNYFGIGIETTFFNESVAFYQKLGFEPGSEITEKSQYLSMRHPDGCDLTLYKPGICPHGFHNPSLTYFNGKDGNKLVIEKLLELGISPKEEITVFNPEGLVDNIIISDPGGLHSFIFNDG